MQAQRVKARTALRVRVSDRQTTYIMRTNRAMRTPPRTVFETCELTFVPVTLLLDSVLDLLFVQDISVFPLSTRQAWTLAELEVSDGIYHRICFLGQIALEQYAVSVLVSLVVVGLTQFIYWPSVLSGESAPYCR